MFFLQVCEKCLVEKHASEELWWSEVQFELPLFPSHFHNGRLTLQCVAQIGDLYKEDVQITLYNVKDPEPARGKCNFIIGRVRIPDFAL